MIEPARGARSTGWAGCSVAVWLVLALGYPLPARGQLTGVPVPSGGLPTVETETIVAILLHTTSGGDFVGPDTDAERGWTLSNQLKAGPFSVRTLVGLLDRDLATDEGGTKPQAAILIGWNFLHEPTLGQAGTTELGVSLVGGAGYGALGRGEDETSLLLGVDVAGVFAMGGWFIYPAVIPRFTWRQSDLRGGRGEQIGFGVSLEIAAGFEGGIGVIVSGDLLWYGGGSGSLDLEPVDVRALAIGMRQWF